MKTFVTVLISGRLLHDVVSRACACAFANVCAYGISGNQPSELLITFITHFHDISRYNMSILGVCAVVEAGNTSCLLIDQ